MKYRFLFFVLLFLSLPFMFAKLKVSQDLYKIDLIVGKVELLQSGSDYWEEAESDMLLPPKTQIRTEKDSYCDLILPQDAGIFRVTPNSIIELAIVGRQIKRVNLKKGKIFINIVPGKTTHFEVETRVAVAAVRGTRFIVQTDGNRVKTQVTKGKVVVRRNISLPMVTGIEDNTIAVETDAGEEIEMTLAENRELENLLSRVKGNLRNYKRVLSEARKADRGRKHLIRNVKEIMADLYDTDNKLQNYGEDEKALDKHIDTIHKRRW